MNWLGRRASRSRSLNDTVSPRWQVRLAQRTLKVAPSMIEGRVELFPDGVPGRSGAASDCGNAVTTPGVRPSTRPGATSSINRIACRRQAAARANRCMVAVLWSIMDMGFDLRARGALERNSHAHGIATYR